MSWCPKTRCLGNSGDSFWFFRVSFFQEWEKASKREEGESCIGGIVAVCLPSAGNELVKEKSKWFIGRKGGNRGREDSEKERKRLGVIGESLCLFVFSLFLFFTTSHLSFPPCPFVKHSTTPLPFLHPPHTHLPAPPVFTLHPLCQATLTLSKSISVLLLFAHSLVIYLCHLFVCLTLIGLPSFSSPEFLWQRRNISLVVVSPCQQHTSFGTRAKNVNWYGKSRGKYSLFNIPFTHEDSMYFKYVANWVWNLQS